MSRALTVTALLAALALAAPQPAPANENQLRAQVRTLKKSRDLWKQRAQDRADEIDALESTLAAFRSSDLAPQIGALAAAGRITELHRIVLEPIRLNWPCGATLYQGTSFWSLDMNLSDTDFSGDEIVTKHCDG